MYVYVYDGYDCWTVGFYRPDGKFEPDSDHKTPEAAAERVHWLNGGCRIEA